MTRLTLVLCAAALAWPTAARAQDGPPVDAYDSEPPAHIAFVEGSAVLERDGAIDNSPSNMPLLSGDRLRTQGGRVEILFGDGSTLHLDANTTVDFQSDELVRLLAGRIRLAIPASSRDVSYRVDASSAWAVVSQPGEYRMAILAGEPETEIELAVLRGAAELANDNGRTRLRAGERAFSRAHAAPSLAYVFNSASWDAFDRWCETRHDERRALSTQYLPEQVRPYAASFDRYGTWRQDPSYGRVWYPRVSVGWRPYHNGRWATLRHYGWTWIGSDAWAWPTHHYGRWGISAGVWFWIPGRSWAPAWVSWAYAPGYVSWCPLGWNNRPVVQIVYNRGHDPWRAWTAVPQRHFEGRYVSVRGASLRGITARNRGTFVQGSRAPAHRSYAVPRGAAPIRSAGTGGPRRGTSPVYSNLQGRDARVTGPSRTIVPQGTDSRSRASSRATTSGPATVPRASADRSRGSALTASPGRPGDARVAPRTANRYGTDTPRAVLRERGVSGATPISPRAAEPSADRSTAGPSVATRSAPRGDAYRRDPIERRPAESYRAPGIERGEPGPAFRENGPGTAARTRGGAPRDSGAISGEQGGGGTQRSAARSERGSAGSENVTRAAPRDRGPRESAPPPAPRQSPGVERRGPAPDRPSSPSPAGASRPRSEGQPSGRAVRRPGGG